MVIATLTVLRGIRGRVSPPIGLAIAGLIVVTTILTSLPDGWLNNHERAWAGTLLVVAVAGMVWATQTRSRPADRRSLGFGGGGARRPRVAV